MSICTDVLKMPSWLKKKLPNSQAAKELSLYLKANSIETVCVNSRCPNACECYSTGNISFLILGNTCTRNCLFCTIHSGIPKEISTREHEIIAKTVRKLNLRYVVITSVTRDDIADGGAGHYADVVKAIKEKSPETVVETLVPDFKGSEKAIYKIIEAGVDVFSHNMETVAALYPEIRPSFDYSRSLDVLRYAASLNKTSVKSGFMVGLGEKESEIDELLRDIKATNCAFLTIGQYLRPKESPVEVKEYLHPQVFVKLKEKALRLGFEKVASGPSVRSSYKAGEFFTEKNDE